MVPELPELDQWLKWVEYWKPVLSLSDWRIRVEFVPEKKLSDSRHTAECWANWEQETAVIKIAVDSDPADYFHPDLLDWEETLVHELLHCVVDVSNYHDVTEPYQKTLYEQAISRLARGLVALKRRAEEQKDAT